MTTKHALKKVALLYPLDGVRPPDDVNGVTQRSLTGRWKTELSEFFAEFRLKRHESYCITCTKVTERLFCILIWEHPKREKFHALRKIYFSFSQDSVKIAWAKLIS